MAALKELFDTAKNNNGEMIEAAEQKGYEAGRYAEWSEFWDAVQDYGKKTDYRGDNGFQGNAWNDVTFKPKYLIQPTNISTMFYYSKIQEATYTDLLDFSKASGAEQFLSNSTVKRLKIVDFRGINCAGYNLYLTFASNGPLSYIEEFYPPIKGSNDLTDLFARGSFTHIKFCSEILKSGVNLRNANLDKESIDSVIYWLSPDTTELSVTLPLAAVNKNYETAAGANDGSTSPEWLDKVASKPNWTINLS